MLKNIAVSVPSEVYEILSSMAVSAPRSLLSIKLLRAFFKENPPLRDMSGLMDQETHSFTLRVPQELIEQLEHFAARMGYTRHTALLVALVAQIGAEQPYFREPTSLPAGNVKW